MRLLQTILLVFVFAVLAVCSAQDYSQLFAGFGPYLRQTAGMRDPRSNRGPVLFPPGPPPNSADTSGVVAGASGFGFVPPNQAFYRFFYY
ncbi:worker-enriched antennal transcript isoform X1 [Lasioglossum baleicum]|uniref:worker-enriched antennal transcript isoform X1 n=1 Tax=Lasioglossum baleicum TaxID=434251 RepID=UPI003FCE8AA9